MKGVLAGIIILAVGWIALWMFNVGVLVSSAETVIPMTRECRYFIGVSVLKRIEPLAERCPLMRTIGA